MRLRPSGEGLPLVTVTAFTNYQYHTAAVWEHQALVRTRLVCGSRQLKQAFCRVRHNILQRQPSREILGKEISVMRKKMRDHLDKKPLFALKHGKGGIIDIEFIVQYGVLAWGKQHPELTQDTGTLRLLSLFGKLGLLSKLQVKHLRAAYALYIQLLHHAMLNQIPPLVPYSRVLPHPSRIQAVWEALVYN